MGDDNIQMVDGDGSKELTIGAISLEQYRRCCIEGSKEMLRGGYTRKVVNGSVVEIEVPNQREIYVNCVKQFAIIMIPQLNKKINAKILNNIQEIEKEWLKSEKEARSKEGIVQEKYGKNIELFNRHIEIINENLENKKVKLSEEKLAILSVLLEEINYYGEGGVDFG